MARKHIIGFGIGVFVLLLLTAGASALVTKEIMTEKPAIQKTAKSSGSSSNNQIAWNEPRQPTQKSTPACDDKNIVGYVLGGAAGGIAGNQIGKGTGKTAATIGGTLGGGYLGGEYIPTHNVTCR